MSNDDQNLDKQLIQAAVSTGGTNSTDQSNLEQFDQSTLDNQELKVLLQEKNKLCCLETRNIGVTRTNLAVMFTFYFFFSLAGWVASYNVFFIERFILSPEEKAEADTVQQKSIIIGLVIQLPISLSIGIIYDTLGRRKPMLFAWSLAAIAIIWFPFNTNKNLYYLINQLIVPFSCTFTLPFIPDLIKEESQPKAILLTLLGGAIGKACIAKLLTFVADTQTKYPDTEGVVYLMIGILIALFVIYSFFGMKDVIQSKDFELRRERSDTGKARQRASYILKQGLKLVWKEPFILFGILGLTQSNLLLQGAVGTSTQAVIYNYTQLGKKDPIADATTFTSKSLLFVIFLGIPFAIISTKLSQSEHVGAVFAVEGCFVLLNGILYIAYYDQIGDTFTLVLSGFFAAFDLASAIICQSMLFKKLMPDSRGIITSFILVSQAFFGIIQAVATIYVQEAFGDNYRKGGKYNMSIWIVTQALLTLAALIWQCKVCLTKKGETPLNQTKPLMEEEE